MNSSPAGGRVRNGRNSGLSRASRSECAQPSRSTTSKTQLSSLQTLWVRRGQALLSLAMLPALSHRLACQAVAPTLDERPLNVRGLLYRRIWKKSPSFYKQISFQIRHEPTSRSDGLQLFGAHGFFGPRLGLCSFGSCLLGPKTDWHPGNWSVVLGPICSAGISNLIQHDQLGLLYGGVGFRGLFAGGSCIQYAFQTPLRFPFVGGVGGFNRVSQSKIRPVHSIDLELYHGVLTGEAFAISWGPEKNDNTLRTQLDLVQLATRLVDKLAIMEDEGLSQSAFSWLNQTRGIRGGAGLRVRGVSSTGTLFPYFWIKAMGLSGGTIKLLCSLHAPEEKVPEPSESVTLWFKMALTGNLPWACLQYEWSPGANPKKPAPYANLAMESLRAFFHYPKDLLEPELALSTLKNTPARVRQVLEKRVQLKDASSGYADKILGGDTGTNGLIEYRRCLEALEATGNDPNRTAEAKQALDDYLSKGSSRPLLTVVGRSGSGKTHVISKAAELLGLELYMTSTVETNMRSDREPEDRAVAASQLLSEACSEVFQGPSLRRILSESEAAKFGEVTRHLNLPSGEAQSRNINQFFNFFMGNSASQAESSEMRFGGLPFSKSVWNNPSMDTLVDGPSMSTRVKLFCLDSLSSALKLPEGKLDPSKRYKGVVVLNEFDRLLSFGRPEKAWVEEIYDLALAPVCSLILGPNCFQELSEKVRASIVDGLYDNLHQKWQDRFVKGFSSWFMALLDGTPADPYVSENKLTPSPRDTTDSDMTKEGRDVTINLLGSFIGAKTGNQKARECQARAQRICEWLGHALPQMPVYLLCTYQSRTRSGDGGRAPDNLSTSSDWSSDWMETEANGRENLLKLVKKGGFVPSPPDATGYLTGWPVRSSGELLGRLKIHLLPLNFDALYIKRSIEQELGPSFAKMMSKELNLPEKEIFGGSHPNFKLDQGDVVYEELAKLLEKSGTLDSEGYRGYLGTFIGPLHSALLREFRELLKILPRGQRIVAQSNEAAVLLKQWRISASDSDQPLLIDSRKLMCFLDPDESPDGEALRGLVLPSHEGPCR